MVVGVDVPTPNAPATYSVVPLNVKFASLFRVTPPALVITRSSLAFVIVVVPEEPEEPLDPEEPEVPDEPLAPEEPDVPEEPEEPEEPLDPLEPEVPEEPLDPDVPEEPEEPLDPEVPDDPLDPEEPLVPEVCPVYDCPFNTISVVTKSEPLIVCVALNVLLPVVAKRTELVVFRADAFDVVPLIVAFIVPSTVRSPKKRAEPDTFSDPEMFASNIFIGYIVIP